MFRRRRFMRPFRRGFTPIVSPLLLEANRAMQNGEYDTAAKAFEQLASMASTGRRHRAPMFLLQAGIARVHNDQIELGMDHLKQGFSQLALAGEAFRFNRVRRFVVQDLMESGHGAEADVLNKFLNDRAPLGSQVEREAAEPEKKPVLPTHCPSCGAAIRSGEVEWLDEMTAECAYCGSPVRGT